MNGFVEIDGLRRRASEEGELAIRRRLAFLPDNPWLPVARTAREFLLAVRRLERRASNDTRRVPDTCRGVNGCRGRVKVAVG
jgi:ABC-type multidrug transport system ATPase subunit